jgi:hypothetical protein
VVLAVVWGCGEASPRPAMSRDSAGIEIVENGRLPDRVAYRLGEPLYRVGWESGDHLWQRIQSGALLTGGRAAIADGGGAREVVVLSPSGAVDAVLGGPGKGPGEFGYLNSIHHLGGDTLLAVDTNIVRATLFHEGRVVRTYPLEYWTFYKMRAIGTDATGGVTMVSAHYWPYTEQPWILGAVARYDLTNARADTLIRFDWVPGISQGDGANLIGPGGRVAASPRNLFVTRTDRTQVERYAHDGRVVQLIRWTEERRPFDDTVWAAMEANLRSTRAPSPRTEELLAGWRSAAEGPLPYATNILTDDSGNVWLSEYAVDRRYPARYRVFSESGTFRGWVVMPARFEVLDIARGFVLGVHRDELDVAAIALYRLEQ